MYAETIRATITATLSTILLAFAPATASQAAGRGPAKETSCHVHNSALFVQDCLHQTKNGTRLPSAIEPLSCIARTNRGGRNVNTSAVRVGFVIADKEGVAGPFLLSVIQDSETPVPAHRLACQLVRYVANPEIEAAMFQTFKNTWTSNHSVMYFEVFRAMRNLEFLAWVDERLEHDALNPGIRTMLGMEAELIRVQQDREQILQYITSPEHPILYRTWLTRHALRCGITRAELRRTFLSMLQEHTPLRQTRGSPLGIFEAMEELEVFGEEDVAVLKPLRDGRLQFSIWPTDPVPLWIEEIFAAKRAVFFGAARAMGGGK